jgi:hypothetical protein
LLLFLHFSEAIKALQHDFYKVKKSLFKPSKFLFEGQVKRLIWLARFVFFY